MTDAITIYNVSTGNRIELNKDVGEYWLDTIDWGTVEAENKTFKFIGQVGVTNYDVALGTRTIVIEGWVAGYDRWLLQEQKRRLNTMINPTQTLEIWRDGKYKLTFLPRASVRYPNTVEENNLVMCKFRITGFCPYPLFEPMNERRTVAAETERRFHFPLVIPKGVGIVMGVRQPSAIATLVNDGDFDIGYVITLQSRGTVVNPKIIDVATQNYIRLNVTMSSDMEITINTKPGERSIVGTVGGVESNFFQYRDFGSSWLVLRPGENSIGYTADEGLSALEVVLRYSPGYLEVEA